MDTVADLTWTLPAPQGAPAYYDVRHCLMRTTREATGSIFEALNSKDLSRLAHGAELLHELVHLWQDISTGWGFYGSELFMALTVAQAGVVSAVVTRTGRRDTPLVQHTGPPLSAICPTENSELSELRRLWQQFVRGSSDQSSHLSAMDIVESHAFAYQLIEHLLSGDFDAVRRGMNRPVDQYTRAFNGTSTAIGAIGERGADDAFLMLRLHQVFCELAFAVGPASGSPRLQPSFATADDFRRVMPEGLADRFMRILVSAHKKLRPMTEPYLSRSKSSAEDFDRIVAQACRYQDWLEGVEVLLGDRLDSVWMEVFSSPAAITTNVTHETDPIRAYRSWAMKHYDPLRHASRPTSQLLKLLAMIPAFRLDDGHKAQWYFELDQEKARGTHLNAVTIMDFLGRVGGDLNGRLVMNVLPSFFLTERAPDVPCPYVAECSRKQEVCAVNMAQGLVAGCRAERVPAQTMGLNMRKVCGRVFNT